MASPIEGCTFNLVSYWHGQLYVGIQRVFRNLESACSRFGTRVHIQCMKYARLGY